MYRIPSEYFFRLHHIRPRFKSDVESVLFFMANEIARLEPSSPAEFKKKLNIIITQYPSNGSKTNKTINNWRTEISTLFGLIEYDEETARPSRMAKTLSESSDLVEFFRYFLYYFQYPGGHLKPKESLRLIQAGIKFKPVGYMLATMMEGHKLLGERKFGLTKAEATHCIFNDLRVTRGQRSPAETAGLILKLREREVEFDQSGDVVRYAGDILDYMELADLVSLRPNYQYYAKTVEFETIQGFISSTSSFFSPYENLYGEVKSTNLGQVKNTQFKWFEYVNDKLDKAIFKADVLSILGEADDSDNMGFVKSIIETLQSKIQSNKGIKTKEIGDIGESIVIEHEKARLTNLDREGLVHLIKKIPEQFAVGYDISSYSGDGDIRNFIEVKTTISRGALAARSFQMTPSEWSAANSTRENYNIYRLMISTCGVKLFIINDPVGKYKADVLDMTPRNGASIRYSDKSGFWEPLAIKMK